MSHRNWQFRIEDIDEALEKIGEAASHVPQDIQEQFSDVPWYQMKGMRNVLIHEYFGIDNEILWKTIQEDLPQLKTRIKHLMKLI